jgi:hypothetical protein
MDRELTPKQQTSEAIRQAETILILTGQHPSIDQAASTIALTAILRKFGKKVTAVVSDEIPAGARFLPTELVETKLGGLRDFIIKLDLRHAEVDKLKYTIEEGKLNVHVTPFSGGFDQKDVSFGYGDYQFDLILILGVASYSRIDRVYSANLDTLQSIPMINIDFHRTNEEYGAINLIEPNAASLNEILLALAESLQTGIVDGEIATTMLTGIMASTDRFTATHTTSKALTVAAQMVSLGADHQKVVKGLYKDRGSRNNQGKDQVKDFARREIREVQREETPVRQPQPESKPEPEDERPEPARKVPEVTSQNDLPAPVQPRKEQAEEQPVNPKAEEPAAPVAPAKPDEKLINKAHAPLENLLPPNHIEMTPLEELETMQTGFEEPEPLINATDEAPKPRPGLNPANRPLFAERLNDKSSE